MKVLGYAVVAAGFIALFLNGSPQNWSNGKLPFWIRLLIDIVAIAVMALGYYFIAP